MDSKKLINRLALISLLSTFDTANTMNPPMIRNEKPKPYTCFNCGGKTAKLPYCSDECKQRKRIGL